jgi:hypothetical protein
MQPMVEQGGVAQLVPSQKGCAPWHTLLQLPQFSTSL